MNAHAKPPAQSGIETRLQAVLGPERARQTRQIAATIESGDGSVIEAFGQLPDVAPVEQRGRRPRTVFVPVLASEAVAAGGVDLIRRTVAAVERPDSPDMQSKARAVIEALRSIAPQTAVEGSLAGLFVATERMAFDTMAIARIAGLDSPVGMVMLARSEKLACRAAELAEAISRQRSKGKTQHIVVQHIHGGQAVGMVNQGE
jgi:hypothetical protein